MSPVSLDVQSTTDLTGIASGSRFVDHAALASDTRRAAAGLRSLGLASGATIGILMRNDPDFLVAQSACGQGGFFAVPLNWHASLEDIGYVLRDAGASALVVHADLLARYRVEIPVECELLVVETPIDLLDAYRIPSDLGAVRPGDTNWRTWLAGFEPLADHEISRGGSLAISYTSGTTGRPKGVTRAAMTPEMAKQAYSIVDEVFGVEAGEPVRVLVSAPIYHGAPNFFANRGIVEGSLAVLQPRFEAEQVLALIEQYRVSHMYMVPTTMLKLLDLAPEIRARYDLSSLKRVIHSAAPCPREVKQRMIDWLGPVIYEFYGGTETGSVTMLSSLEALAKPGSVGRLLRNCRLKVFDDDGREVGTGEVGEIYARNFNLPRFQYLHLPEKQAEVERDDLASIGDVGYIDDEGFVFLCDRKRDMVISAGVNIYPAELEAVLLSMPGVADSIVFGIPDPVYGEALCAHVEPRRGVSLVPDDVIAWMRARVASYQVPATVVIDHNLPREESGKIMKRKTRDLYWANAGRVM